MRLRRALIPLVTTVAAICVAMLAATLLAQASSGSLGRTLWLDPQNVSDPANSDLDTEVSPDIGVDSSGNIHIIWAQGASDATRDPYYTYSTDGGHTWSSPDDQDTTRGSYDTTLLAKKFSAVHTAWCEFRALPTLRSWVYYSLISKGSWSATAEVVTRTEYSSVSSPSLAVAKGYIHLVWSQMPQGAHYDLYYSRRDLDGGKWSVPTMVVDTAENSLYPSMAKDDHGRLHLVWQEDLVDGDEIHYISGTIGVGSTTWSSPISISRSVTEATTPDAVVGDDGIVHVAFGQRIAEREQYVWYRNFPIADPDLGTPSMIPDSQVGISYVPPYYTHPSIGLKGTNEIHIVWNGQMGPDAADLIYHVVSTDQGASWSTPVAASDDEGHPDRYPALYVTEEGGVHAAWQQLTTSVAGEDKDIYYSNYRLGIFFPLGVKNYP